MVFKKIIFQNSLMANEPPPRPPPPFMANAILNFHFDFLHTSLTSNERDLYNVRSCPIFKVQKVEEKDAKITEVIIIMEALGGLHSSAVA